MFVDNPVFGVGFGGFKAYNSVTEFIKYPHNIFVEMAVEGGVIGLLVLCALCFVLFRAVYKFSTYCLLLTAYCLLLSFFSKDLPSQTVLWIWLAFIGLTKVQNSESNVRSLPRI
jgi:hypothetical protein